MGRAMMDDNWRFVTNNHQDLFLLAVLTQPLIRNYPSKDLKYHVDNK